MTPPSSQADPPVPPAPGVAQVDSLVPVLYEELRRVAARVLSHERGPCTMHATSLVHEAYLRLARGAPFTFHDQSHLLAISARLMRQIVVDAARLRGAAKRGGGSAQVLIADESVAAAEQAVDILALDEALDRLQEIAPKQARIVELRFFGGLTDEESAVALGVSAVTVRRWWRLARAWLYREMSGSARRGGE